MKLQSILFILLFSFCLPVIGQQSTDLCEPCENIMKTRQTLIGPVQTPLKTILLNTNSEEVVYLTTTRKNDVGSIELTVYNTQGGINTQDIFYVGFMMESGAIVQERNVAEFNSNGQISLWPQPEIATLLTSSMISRISIYLPDDTRIDMYPGDAHQLNILTYIACSFHCYN